SKQITPHRTVRLAQLGRRSRRRAFSLAARLHRARSERDDWVLSVTKQLGTAGRPRWELFRTWRQSRQLERQSVLGIRSRFTREGPSVCHLLFVRAGFGAGSCVAHAHSLESVGRTRQIA